MRTARIVVETPEDAATVLSAFGCKDTTEHLLELKKYDTTTIDCVDLWINIRLRGR